MIRVAINGAAGRMGKRLTDLASQNSEIQVAAALESENHPELGKDAGELAGIGNLGIPVQSEFVPDIDVMIDFSSPEGAERALAWSHENSKPIVLATTGLEDSTLANIPTYSKAIPIVWAPNMSLAVNLSMKLSEIAATALKEHSSGVDVEIVETHHRFKADSPSGTALKFGSIIAAAMGQTSEQHGRSGMVGERPRNEIGYHAVRAGDDPGQHTILFGMMGEKIEIKVAASNRDCYASGALQAALFLANQKPGLYSMYDVLGLDSN